MKKELEQIMGKELLEKLTSIKRYRLSIIRGALNKHNFENPDKMIGKEGGFIKYLQSPPTFRESLESGVAYIQEMFNTPKIKEGIIEDANEMYDSRACLI